jgi:hypothetical protein
MLFSPGCCPFPMVFITPKFGVLKQVHILFYPYSIALPPTMIKMQMSKNIRNIITMKTMFAKICLMNVIPKANNNQKFSDCLVPIPVSIKLGDYHLH